MFIKDTSILYIENFIDEDMLDTLKSLIMSDYDDFYAKEIVSERLESRSFVFDSKYDDIVNHIYQKASLKRSYQRDLRVEVLSLIASMTT